MSIQKRYFPATCPDLSYDILEGVTAYRETIAPETTPERWAQIERELLPWRGLGGVSGMCPIKKEFTCPQRATS